ncbi:mechanosensitive ion channel family protein [Halalkalibacillus halophilus]|uniref:mechanosensitive ion channel family protein n=1 Tax=Halalkalibacillus halophilus TaxID=392827 RepID=UPI0004224C80|nr:mechanosensitive ion channel family protein [Halalkalibacillus halophilus]
MNLDFITQYISLNELINIGIAFAIILFVLFLRKIFTKYIFYFFKRLAKKAKSELLDYIFDAFEKPIRWLLMIIGIYIAAYYFPYLNQQSELFTSLIKVFIIVVFTWGAFNLASSSSLLLMKVNEKINFKIDQILIPFLSKAIRFVVIAISLTIILQEFEYDVSGFIAGLGLGGLAFALAAQEVIKNFFGGIVIITEKPFTIDDWIETPSVEGIVEDISFRSTIVRTFSESLVTIPNATLSNEPITNWSEMGRRRIYFELGVEYITPREKLESAVSNIREMLENNDDIHPETLLVRFHNYNEGSLDIMIYCFTHTIAWEEWMAVKEEVNYNVMDILEKEGVSIAFPTRKLFLDAEDSVWQKTQDTLKSDNPEE